MENEQVKQKFPIGMILILILVGWGALGLLLGMFKIPMSQLGPFVVSGAGAIIINLIIVGILVTIFYGIIKRLKWAKKLAIGWYIFSMILAPINLFSFLAHFPPGIFRLSKLSCSKMGHSLRQPNCRFETAWKEHRRFKHSYYSCKQFLRYQKF